MDWFWIDSYFDYSSRNCFSTVTTDFHLCFVVLVVVLDWFNLIICMLLGNQLTMRIIWEYEGKGNCAWFIILAVHVGWFSSSVHLGNPFWLPHSVCCVITLPSQCAHCMPNCLVRRIPFYKDIPKVSSFFLKEI